MRTSNKKVKVCHFLNGNFGGVYSVIENLITNSRNKKLEHYIIVAVSIKKKYDFTKVNYLDNSKQQLFYYDPKWNFYYTCRKLSKLLPNDNCVIVANDWLELGMISMLGLNNPVVQIVHGNYEYYFNLTKTHKSAINNFIAVSELISDNVKSYNDDVNFNIQHIPYPVSLGQTCKVSADKLRILFVAADLRDSNKNFNYVKDINLILEEYKIKVSWNIVGNGYSQQQISEWWNDCTNEINYYGLLSSEKLKSLYQASNVFLLPSIREGLPVSLIEAMSHGLTPVINSWDYAEKLLVKHGYNGFIVKENNPLNFATILIEIQNNMRCLSFIGKCASESVANIFNPFVQTSAYENIFLKSSVLINSRYPNKVYGSRLDHPLIPNILTTTYRKIKNIFNG